MASQVDWYYHRTGCKTCSRMDALLEAQGITAKEVVSAHKQKFDFAAARKLLSGVTRIVASKGTKAVEIDLKRDKPTDEELAAVLIGPTGNLRSPTVRKGGTLLVGFHEEAFPSHLSAR